MDSKGTENNGHGASGLMTRRTVVRGGVTAAWSVPAITVLAASPAFATASGPATLAMSGATTVVSKGTEKNVSSGVRNGGGQPAASLQATVTLTGDAKSGWGSATCAPKTSQWTLSSTTKVTDDHARFVFTAVPTSLAGGATKSFTPTINLPSNSKTGTVTVTFTATTTSGAGLSATSGAVDVP